MAGNNIHGKEQVEEITRVWQNLTKEISNTVNVLEQYQKTTTKLPSQYLNSLNQVKNAQLGYNKAASDAIKTQSAYTATLKENERLAKLELRTKAKLQKELKGETKEYHKLNEELKLVRKERRAEAKAIAETSSLYSRVQNGINKLTKQYNDLAIRKELNGKLSAEEQVTLGKLEAKLNKYNTALKNVDARIGRHQRNVGNYKSGFDGLGFSIAQISREMPAFANSMQTGFMAISNNIPMLFDEIQRLTKANKELAASGKPTTNVLKAIGKGIFSLQSLLSIGVTLLTVYGAKMIETIFPTNEAEKATKAYNEEMAEQNKQLKENIRLRERNLEQTRKFINNPQIVGEFRGMLADIIGDSTRAEAVLTELAERMEKVGISGAEALRNQDLIQSDRLKIAANLLEIEEQKIELEKERLRLSDTMKAREEILEAFNKGEIGDKEKVRRLLQLGTNDLNKTIQIQTRINQLNKANEEIIGNVVELTSEQNKELNAQRQTLKTLLNDWNQYYQNIENGQKKFGELFKDSWDVEVPDIGAELQEKLNNLPSDYKVPYFSEEEMAILEGQFARLGELYGIDASKFTALFDDKENTVSDYVAAAGEAFNGLYAMFQHNYDQDLQRFEENAALQLQFAGDNAEARAELERQLEEKRRALRNKQLQQEKEAAIFSAVINTATAVTAALAEGGIVLAAIVAALGAAEIVAISSRKVPQFKDGVRDFEGGLAVVGDGGVSEVIKTPDGNTFKTPNKDTLVNLPKGSDVYKSETDFHKELNSVLNFNGILPEQKLMPNINIESGLSKEDIAPFFNSLERSINNKKSFEFIWDENGIRKNIVNGTTKTNILNNRVRGVGKGV